jgi:TolA-binding protein
MANVKITDLTALAAIDVADNDVLPIVDVGNDTTKKVAISDMRASIAEANDFVTFTRLDSNISVVQDNVTANFNQLDANINVVQDNVEARHTQLDSNINVVQDNVTANFNQLDANISVVQDNVAAAEANVGLVRSNIDSFASTANSNAAALAAGIAGTSVNLTIDADSGSADTVVVGTDTFTFAGGTGLTSTVSDNQIQFDLDATAVTAGVYGGKIGTVSNVPVLTIDAQGRITAASNSEVAVDLSTLEGNVNTVSSNVSALDVQVNANLDAVQDNVTANFNQLDANINVVQNNVAANFTQLDSNIDVVQGNVASIIDGTTAFTGDVTFEDTTDDSAAGPEFNLFRNSATPVNGDYLGQIKFQGKSDGGTTRLYSKLTGKVSSVTNGSETGLIEVAVRDSGSNKITTRFKGDEIQTLNGVGLNIDGTSSFTDQVTMSDDLIVSGNLTINGDQTVINTTNMEVDDTLIMLANGTTGSPANDIGILFNRGNQGNAAFFYDESAQTFKVSDTLDPSSNTSLSPVTSANLDVGILTAATIKYDGTDISTSITDNVAAVESRRTANIAGAISTVLTTDLTASRALIAGTGGKIEVSDITSTELGYLDGMTQNINSNLAALAAGIAATASGSFPTGDYGLLDSANSSTDSFGVAVAGLTTFDLKTDPAGSLSTEDLGVLT